jgi:SAM-dependent methyltransferase
MAVPRAPAPGRGSASRSWDLAVAPLLAAPEEALWRRHSDAMNAALFAGWLPAGTVDRVLKTDLYDEAMGDGLVPLLAARAGRVWGVDVAAPVLAAARARHPQLLAVAADVRHLPFAAGAFDTVISNSTLDHFASADDIGAALGELRRVLVAGGRLLLTLDNPTNPLVRLRNALPYGWLRRAGLVPYPVGATLGARALARLLERVGFEVTATATLLHCPRVLAVPLARRLQRRGSPAARARLLRGLRRWEFLAAMPTRHLTAHYVAIQARRR